MNISDFLKSYEYSENIVRKLYDSKLRLAILKSLQESPLQLSDLRRKVDANAPNTSSKAKDLESLGLMERKGGVYELTTLGRIVEKHIEKSLGFYMMCEKFNEFWRLHRIDTIPDEFLERIGELKKAQIIRSSKDNVNAPLEMLYGVITSANKFFYGLCTFYHKVWTSLPPFLLSKKIDTELILSENLLRESAKVYPLKMIETIDKQFKFYEIKENALPAFMVTEEFFAMALEPTNFSNMYLHGGLFSKDHCAIRWGLDLLEYYKKESKKVKFADYI